MTIFPPSTKKLIRNLFCLGVVLWSITFTIISLRLHVDVTSSSGEVDYDLLLALSSSSKESVKDNGISSSAKNNKNKKYLISPLTPPSTAAAAAAVANGHSAIISKNEEFLHHYQYDNNTIIKEFERMNGVVIVTKIHGRHQLGLLQQSMCLLHHAYNNKLNYNIVVFTTIPIPDNETLLMDIRTSIAPTTISIVVDNDGLRNEIDKLSPDRRRKFLRRCNATSADEITWDSLCYEEEETATTTTTTTTIERISYNWQAQFRSLHIWHHKSLQPYRYMLWMDTDAFCTKAWQNDPVALAIKNNMVIYFNNYPQGRAPKAAQQIVKKVFGEYLCAARKLSNGQLATTMGDTCDGSTLWTIHGFFHITDLDFFRQDRVLHFQQAMIENCFLCRKFDDQLAVTVPSVVLAPEKSWDMYKSGIELKIFHNNKIDGKRNKKAGGFFTYWDKNAESQFPEAWKKCVITEGS